MSKNKITEVVRNEDGNYTIIQDGKIVGEMDEKMYKENPEFWKKFMDITDEVTTP